MCVISLASEDSFFSLYLILTLDVGEQAYTHELEIKVSRLEEENERLRRQKVMLCSFGRLAILFTHA